jgi:DNA-binding LacI/PurR family transcriptional regulator
MNHPLNGLQGPLSIAFFLANLCPLAQVEPVSSTRFSSVTAQVTGHLREGVTSGRWRTLMPGRTLLARELRVSGKTVESALKNLEAEGLLLRQGAGRRRLIAKVAEENAGRPMTVALLLSAAVDRSRDYIIQLERELTEAGHTVIHNAKPLVDLRMDVSRIGPLVEATEADAWVIGSGSRSVLEWFAARPEPAFALFGRREGLPMAAAGPNKVPAYIAATRKLIDLGHRRITLLARPRRRLPKPGRTEQAFLNELEAQDLPVGNFNLPDWEDRKEGLQRCLSSLFQVTPPTALICGETLIFAAALQFLAARGLRVPRGVSLVCSDADPTFAWAEPSVAHIRWNPQPVVRCIVRWAANVSRGKEDRRQTFTKAKFVEGGTMGPAPGRT